MKKLYSFTINNEEEIEVKDTQEGEKGEKIEITRKEKTKVPKKFFIRRPNRSMHDEADLFYHVVWSEGIKAGMLPRALLIKRFSNDGGVLSKDEQDKIVKMYEELFKKQNEFQRLILKNENDRNEEEKKRYSQLIQEISQLQVDVENFELQQNNLFQNTAEYRARNKSILWWVLNLSYQIDDKDKEIPLFSGETFEEKIKKYDEIIDSEEELKANNKNYIITAIRKFMLLISCWYTQKINEEKDFEQVDKATS